MAEYFATVHWARGADELYVDNEYSRAHTWSFDGGASIAASASPHVVPLPHSVEANVDPEEAFIAALSSCHMLFFLSIAAKERFVVDRYRDEAVGIMARNQWGQMAMTLVTLRPRVSFGGEVRPSPEQIMTMHGQAHEKCFIANSVKTEVVTRPVFQP